MKTDSVVCIRCRKLFKESEVSKVSIIHDDFAKDARGNVLKVFRTTLPIHGYICDTCKEFSNH